MNILFISYPFPPISSPGSMRIFNFAKYLSKQNGYKIDVLYCPNGYSSMIDYNRDWDFGEINLIPVSELINIKKLTSSNNKLNKTRSPIVKNKNIRILKSLNKLVFPDRHIFWALNVIKKNPLDNKYDYILCSYPSKSNLILGHYYSTLFKTPLIVDMRDLWTQDPSYTQKSSYKQFIEKKIEFRILSNSNMILTVSKFNALQLSNLYGNKVEVIYNGFEDEKFQNQSIKKRSSKDDTLMREKKIRIAYAGSFYGGQRKIDMLFKAIKSLKDREVIDKTNFCFDIYGNEEDYVLKLITKYQLYDLVFIKGLVNQDVLFEKLRNYNLLLVVTRSAPISTGELTTKVFEYIALGTPILCLSKLNYEIVELLNNIEYTYCIDMDNKVAIENTLERFINNESMLSNKRPTNFKFSRDAMSEKLKRLLEIKK